MRICILGHVAIYDHKRHTAGSLWNEDLVNNSLQSMTGVLITFHHYTVLFLWPYNIQYRTRLVKTKDFELNPVHWTNFYFYLKTQRWEFANYTFKVLKCVNGRESVNVLMIQVFLSPPPQRFWFRFKGVKRGWLCTRIQQLLTVI